MDTPKEIAAAAVMRARLGLKGGQLVANPIPHDAEIAADVIGPVIEQALASGAEYLLVEQDDLYGRDAYDCLADSMAHIRSLGY